MVGLFDFDSSEEFQIDERRSPFGWTNEETLNQTINKQTKTKQTKT